MLVITKVSKHVQRENTQGHDMRWSIVLPPFFFHSSSVASSASFWTKERQCFHGARNSFCSTYAWHIKKKFLSKLSMSCSGEVIWELLGKMLKGPFKDLLPDSCYAVDSLIHGYLKIWCWLMQTSYCIPESLKGQLQWFFIMFWYHCFPVGLILP